MGALTGFAIGFLLARLTRQPAAREAVFAATAAAFGALLVVAIQRLASQRIPPQSQAQTPPEASDERDKP
jgi:hypothetical protein